MDDPAKLPPSSLIALRLFLHDIQRSEQFYRDHYQDLDPRLPRLIYQGASKFVLREDGERYKRTLLRSAGMPMRGRPRKVPQPTAD